MKKKIIIFLWFFLRERYLDSIFVLTIKENKMKKTAKVEVKKGDVFTYNNAKSFFNGKKLIVKASGNKVVRVEPVQYTTLWNTPTWTVEEFSELISIGRLTK